MSATLVVMAAGMGSRFGGLKQLEPICDNRVILDFSVYDAKKAGFDKVVFIIRKDIEADFKELVGSRIEKMIDVDYVIQDTTELPEGRTKPFGTAHAILCCKDTVKGPFAIINADDYYGRNAFYEIKEFLENTSGNDFAMVAYDLEKTLSDNGSVARGVCDIKDGKLSKIVECLKIYPDFKYEMPDGEEGVFPRDTKVSMNLWGLTEDIFDVLQKGYDDFKKNANLLKDEYLIPILIGEMVEKGEATVKVFSNKDKWYGITYREDLPEIKEAITKMVADGLYD